MDLLTSYHDAKNKNTQASHSNSIRSKMQPVSLECSYGKNNLLGNIFIQALRPAAQAVSEDLLLDQVIYKLGTLPTRLHAGQDAGF
jgi:hypothetical protein